MATAKKATAARSGSKFKSGRSAPDRPQLMDEVNKLKKRFPNATLERTPQEDGSIVLALTDLRTDPPRAFAIGSGEDNAAAFAALLKSLPAGGAK